MHDQPPAGQVTPFGHPGISGCLLLPLAFRSLPRPSSPGSSKASTMDPYSLDHISLLLSRTSARSPSPYHATSARPNSASYGSHGHQCSTQRALSGSAALALSFARAVKDLRSPPHTIPWRRSHQAPPGPQHSICRLAALMEARGFEPLTYGLQSHRSNQLSYAPGHQYPVTIQQRHCSVS